MTWKQISIEFLSVTFAVLFALGVNEWRDSRNQRDLQKAALKSIYQEIHYNLDMISDANKRNRVHRDSLKKAFDDKKRVDYHDFEVLLLLQTISWETAKQSKALVNIEYDVLVEIAKTYEGFLLLKSYGKSIIDAEIMISGMAALQNEYINNLSKVTTDLGVVNFELILESLTGETAMNMVKILEEKFPYVIESNE